MFYWRAVQSSVDGDDAAVVMSSVRQLIQLSVGGVTGRLGRDGSPTRDVKLRGESNL